MIEIKDKLLIIEGNCLRVIRPNKYKVGQKTYGDYGKQWEVGEDINFDKFWFREVKDD